MSVRRLAWLALLILAACAAGWALAPFVRTTAFLIDVGGVSTPLRAWLPASRLPVTTTDLDIPTRVGRVPARLYQPSGPPRQTTIVFPGVHAGGVDEPRLVTFSERLAATGATVVTVPIPELREFRITPASTDVIEDATRWLAGQSGLAPDGQVGLVGISFAGGLALVAAGRPSLAGRLRAVVSIGGHGDLPRALRYLCGVRSPEDDGPPPHDYGNVLLVLGGLDRLVPPEDVLPTRKALVAFLDASSAEADDPAAAAALLQSAERGAEALTGRARQLMDWVIARDVESLGRALAPDVEELAGDPALSPERSPATRAPVFLLHGRDDTVIPASETPRVAEYLRAHGNTHVRWLLSPVLSHADLDTHPGAGDFLELVVFWRRVLGIMGG